MANESDYVYLGLSNARLKDELFDLGHGVTLSRTYAHLSGPFILAFKEAESGKAHPGPWKAARGGLGFDITAQLRVPKLVLGSDHPKTATGLLFLLRLWIDPEILAPAISTHAFAELLNTPDNLAQIVPYEIQRRHFALSIQNGEISDASVAWVRDNWPTVLRLSEESKEFKLAADSLMLGQFIPNTGLMFVSLWGALEALFSPSTTELQFRVSALIASFLEERGEERLKLQKDIARLYDKRSAAAHGKPSHQMEDLLSTFELLRRVLIRMINMGKVPSREELEKYLFGVL